MEYEDVVEAAPTGDAPTTSAWSTILLLIKVWHILGVRPYTPIQKQSDFVFKHEEAILLLHYEL